MPFARAPEGLRGLFWWVCPAGCWPDQAEQIDLAVPPLQLQTLSLDQMARTGRQRPKPLRAVSLGVGLVFSQARGPDSATSLRTLSRAPTNFYDRSLKLPPRGIEPPAGPCLKTGSAAGRPRRPRPQRQPQPQRSGGGGRPVAILPGELYGSVFQTWYGGQPETPPGELGRRWPLGRLPGAPWVGEGLRPQQALDRCCSSGPMALIGAG